MDPRIDDEPHGAEQFKLQPADVPEWIAGIPPGLMREPFSVERPPFVVRGKRNELAKLRYPAQFLGDRNLPVMPGNAFVIGERRHGPLGDVRHVAKVGIEDAGPRTVESGAVVIGAG